MFYIWSLTGYKLDTKWSPCTTRALSDYLDNNRDYCLRNVPDVLEYGGEGRSMCGNLFVEYGKLDRILY